MSVRDLFDFSYPSTPEDRWLRFTIRLSFVLFLVGMEAVVIAALIRLLWR